MSNEEQNGNIAKPVLAAGILILLETKLHYGKYLMVEVNQLR